MILRRAQRTRQFTVVALEVMNDRRLSAPCLGVLLYLLSKPDNWQPRAGELEARFEAGRDRVRGWLRDLCAAGYARRKVLQAANGALIGSGYEIHEEPLAGGGVGTAQETDEAADDAEDAAHEAAAAADEAAAVSDETSPASRCGDAENTGGAETSESAVAGVKTSENNPRGAVVPSDGFSGGRQNVSGPPSDGFSDARETRRSVLSIESITNTKTPLPPNFGDQAKPPDDLERQLQASNGRSNGDSSGKESGEESRAGEVERTQISAVERNAIYGPEDGETINLPKNIEADWRAFEARWPWLPGEPREKVRRALARLGDAERTEALDGIEPYRTWCKRSMRSEARAAYYLREKLWRTQTAQAPPQEIWVREGTPAFDAWVAHAKATLTRGSRLVMNGPFAVPTMPLIYESRHHGGRRGFSRPTLFPPPQQAGETGQPGEVGRTSKAGDGQHAARDGPGMAVAG